MVVGCVIDVREEVEMRTATGLKLSYPEIF